MILNKLNKLFKIRNVNNLFDFKRHKYYVGCLSSSDIKKINIDDTNLDHIISFLSLNTDFVMFETDSKTNNFIIKLFQSNKLAHDKFWESMLNNGNIERIINEQPELIIKPKWTILE